MPFIYLFISLFLYLFIYLFILVFTIEKYIGKNYQEEFKDRNLKRANMIKQKTNSIVCWNDLQYQYCLLEANHQKNLQIWL